MNRYNFFSPLQGAVQRLPNGNTIYKAGVMCEYEIYTFLHKKHEKLVPKLAAVFRAMKKEGLFEQYNVLAAE